MILDLRRLSMLALAAGLAMPAWSSAQPADAPSARTAIDRALDYVTKEGLAWKRKQKCASCHHVPMATWALAESRARGYAIDDKVLVELREWALDAKSHAKVFPELPLDDTKTETDHLDDR